MNDLNYDWLGFAATSEDAGRIIRETGIFYLTLSVAYLFSFLYMFGHSSTTRVRKRNHCIGVLLWAASGACILIHPKLFSLCLNALIFLLAMIVLFQLQFTSPLMAQGTVKAQKGGTDNKKALYANTLLTKGNYTVTDILGYTLINELILWILILYRAGVTLRASFAL